VSSGKFTFASLYIFCIFGITYIINTHTIHIDRAIITIGYTSAPIIFPLSSLVFSSFTLIVSIASAILPVTSHIRIIETSNVVKIFGKIENIFSKFSHLFNKSRAFSRTLFIFLSRV
jgi:hypothetical protein